MKTSIRTILFTSMLVVGANGLMAAQANHVWLDQWYRTKYGRSSPAEDARLKAERENSAFREESPQSIAPARPNWTAQYFKAKFGRNTPAEEARLKAELDSSAFREERGREATPTKTWVDEWHRAKFGRYPGK